jgi:LacI family transcriptional regulator
MRRATIYDVAELASVSPATVSRHVRGHRVRAGTAIQRAIDQLDYWPTAAAQSLRSGVHYSIAVVVPDITNPYFSALVKGIESVYRPGPYSVVLANSDESEKVEDAVVAELVRRVDGLILAPVTEDEETPLRARDAGVPLVFVDRMLKETTFDSVIVDNVGGAGLAAAHLLSLGHRKVGAISGPLDTTPGRGRRDGFVQQLEQAGVELPDAYDQIANFRESGGFEAMLRLLDLDEPPTAVFCANNLMCAGALKALKGAGVRVPTDMSIVGFDDLDMASLLDPPLTVIDRPSEEQGMIAAHLLQSRLAGSAESPRHVMLPVRLLLRTSTAPPPKAVRRMTATSTSPSLSTGRKGTAGSNRRICRDRAR